MTDNNKHKKNNKRGTIAFCLYNGQENTIFRPFLRIHLKEKKLERYHVSSTEKNCAIRKQRTRATF